MNNTLLAPTALLGNNNRIFINDEKECSRMEYAILNDNTLLATTHIYSNLVSSSVRIFDDNI